MREVEARSVKEFWDLCRRYANPICDNCMGRGFWDAGTDNPQPCYCFSVDIVGPMDVGDVEH